MIEKILDITKANKEITRLKKELAIKKENEVQHLIATDPKFAAMYRQLKELAREAAQLTAENQILKQKESQLKKELSDELSQIEKLEAQQIDATNKTNSILHQLGVPTGKIRF